MHRDPYPPLRAQSGRAPKTGSDLHSLRSTAPSENGSRSPSPTDISSKRSSLGHVQRFHNRVGTRIRLPGTRPLTPSPHESSIHQPLHLPRTPTRALASIATTPSPRSQAASASLAMLRRLVCWRKLISLHLHLLEDLSEGSEIEHASAHLAGKLCQVMPGLASLSSDRPSPP